MAEFGTAIRKGGPATQPSDSTSSSPSNPDYNPKQWWRYSDGVREVIGESIAYIYAKFFFYPSASLADNAGSAISLISNSEESGY
jgi:L,D-peptidoglycan transpeptidase YkuD (ErfK/YbiS/YcfS/YnhG family)